MSTFKTTNGCVDTVGAFDNVDSQVIDLNHLLWMRIAMKLHLASDSKDIRSEIMKKRKQSLVTSWQDQYIAVY